MIKEENYPNAYKEVYVILQEMSKEDRNKIPNSLIEMIENKMNNLYDFKLDPDKTFEEQNLLRETEAILTYIFINYWSTDGQKEEIRQKFRNEILEEENKKGQFDYKSLFRNKKQEKIQTNQEEIDADSVKNDEENKDNNELQLIEYNEPSMISLIIDVIKSFFKRKRKEK